MEEAELQKQRNMVTRSSIQRKPFANLTNIVRKPYLISPFSQSKLAGSSTASDSSIGSTQNPIHENHPLICSPNQPLPSTPPSLTPARLLQIQLRITNPFFWNCIELTLRSAFLAHMIGNEIAYTQRKSTRKNLSKVKDNVSFNQTPLPLCSSRMEEIKEKQKPICMSISTHSTKNTKNTMDTSLPHSTTKIKDKRKESAVQSSYSHLENTNINVPHSSMKKNDKGKSIAVPLNHPPPSTKTKMAEIIPPSSGVIIKDKGKTVMNSSNVDRSQKNEGNVVVTPIYHRTLKKDKRSSCPPLLRTSINRNQDVGEEDTFQLMLKTEPPPNKKKRYTSKESDEEYVLPKEFVDQQRAYFKEIDDFELEVEEV
ncbi:hypothetical protein LXL04_021819 [Taraxacum kok-saghyz]